MGFPDWQRITQWLGPPLLSYQNVTLDASGGYNLATQQYNTSYRGVLVTVFGGSDDVWLEVAGEYKIPPTFFQQIQTTDVFVKAGTKLVAAFDAPLPIQTLVLKDGTSGDDPAVAVYPTNLNPGCYIADSPVLYYAYPTAAIAAGGALAVDLPPYFGEAVVQINTHTVVTWAVQVSTYDTSGTQIGLPWYGKVTSNAGLNEAVYIPPGDNKFTMYNQGGSNDYLYVTVLGKYKSLGGY